MKNLHIQGWLCYDSDGLLAVNKDRDGGKYYAYSIQETIEDFVSERVDHYEDIGLGGKRVCVPDAAMRLYVTNKKCSIDDAMGAVVSYLYGDIHSNIMYEGYSEWTITGYSCEEFRIGGHDLQQELASYVGKYIHLVMQIKE